MASAGSDAGAAPQRTFYCHQCHTRTRPTAEEVNCNACGSDFVEYIADDTQSEHDDEDVDDPYANAYADRTVHLGDVDLQGFFAHAPHNPFLNLLMSNLLSVNGTPVGGRPAGEGPFASLIQVATGAGAGPSGAVPMVPLYGNPGDYAWGRGGLDAIVTQLLNQMDGNGPPPMAADGIRSIPTVKVDQSHIDSDAKCSVCWEEFAVGEDVRQLKCDHIFHDACIVPWLELHNTCPVCRKEQDESGAQQQQQQQQVPASQPAESSPLQNTLSSMLNQFFSVASPSPANLPAGATSSSSSTSQSTSSTSTSGATTSTTTTSPSSRSSRPNPGPSFQDMDLE